MHKTCRQRKQHRITSQCCRSVHEGGGDEVNKRPQGPSQLLKIQYRFSPTLYNKNSGCKLLQKDTVRGHDEPEPQKSAALRRGQRSEAWGRKVTFGSRPLCSGTDALAIGSTPLSGVFLIHELVGWARRDDGGWFELKR